MRSPIKFYWKKFHHLYIGLFIIAYAFIIVLDEYYSILTNNYFLLGAYIFVDDLIDHTITANTPLGILYERVLYPIMKKIKTIFSNIIFP
jgi:hypothetical protein